MQPMLARSVDLGEIGPFLSDPQYVVQQKVDGDRLLIDVNGHAVRIFGRDGQLRSLPTPAAVVRPFQALDGPWQFDGELADGRLWLFDLPLAAVVEPKHPYEFRLQMLEKVLSMWNPGDAVRLLPTARSAAAKHRLLNRVIDAHGEGVMIKRLNAPYQSKRSRHVLKAKLTHTIDAVVTRVRPEGKDNAYVGAFNDDLELVEIGSVHLAGKPEVAPGMVVEIRYLYADTNRRLVQPTMLRVRWDKEPIECTMDQLWFTNRDVQPLDVDLGGLRSQRVTRSTGTRVEVWDADHPSCPFPRATDRWLTVCEHDTRTWHRTLRTADRAAAHPDQWCQQCTNNARSSS